MAVVVTEDEKVRARHHLGYVDVEAVQSFNAGIPAAMQTTFMIEGALNRLLPAAYEKFQQFLCRLDAVEEEVFCGIDLASVDQLDTLKIRSDRLRELSRYYKIAQEGLANMLGVPPNPWDARSWLSTGSGINARVVG